MPIPAAPRPHSKPAQTIGENLGAFKRLSATRVKFDVVPLVPTFRRTSNNIWPKFRKLMNHGKPMFMANANREAETWAQLQRVKRQNEGGPRIPGRRACGL
jgi:hypothetical protein